MSFINNLLWKELTPDRIKDIGKGGKRHIGLPKKPGTVKQIYVANCF